MTPDLSYSELSECPRELVLSETHVGVLGSPISVHHRALLDCTVTHLDTNPSETRSLGENLSGTQFYAKGCMHFSGKNVCRLVRIFKGEAFMFQIRLKTMGRWSARRGQGRVGRVFTF